jgi:hypothetical protein
MKRLITAKFEGVTQTHTLTEWARMLGVRRKTLSSRIELGFSDEQVINHQLGERRHKVMDFNQPGIEQLYQKFCFHREDKKHAIR